ncbi:ABC transporter substrate-binding protein [Falsibacillus pallidus]|uniref:Carbohydrate ABC transporter substrate-binding protein (CUT1 family) n=1 Tax=Falsibacillus pallidus TaxID=493781 RepID=A0A370FY56_9BACI|nr:sugar ABC transporter substrate-binding protein [Falsibacillus pallidus]RDI36472.1 carbohydrate ABC transporter substrate-binding protein (CUT1 family) [Falsibacillus pallidus]
MKAKGLWIVALVMILSIFVSACSGGKDVASSDDGKKDVKDGEKTKLVMYSWRPEDRSMYEKAIAAFQDKNPNIEIEFQPYKSTEYNTILTNALVSGEGPDIIQLRPYEGAKSIADNGYIMPLDDVKGVSDINEQFLDAARGSDGKVYGVPLSLNSAVIFYNKKIFKDNGIDVPTTYEEFLNVCEKLKDKGITPIAQSGRAAYLLSLTHAAIGPTAYGANDFVDKVLDGSAKLTDPEFVKSVQWMSDLKKYFPKDFVALEDNDAQTLLYTGKAAMYINGDYRLATLEDTAPDMEIGIIPGFAEEKGGTPVVTTWVDGSYAGVKNSKHPEEVKAFMEFLASPEFGKIFTDEMDRVSAISGIKPDNEIVSKLAEAVDQSSTPYLMLVHFGKGEPTTKTTFENALQGMYLGKLSVDEVAKQAEESYEKAK